MKTLVLVAHEPSDETVAFCNTLGDEVVIYQYLFSIPEEKIDRLLPSVFATLRNIDKAVGLESFGKIVLSPPGMSIAAAMFVTGLRGATGQNIELLYLMFNSEKGCYVPVKGSEIHRCGAIYSMMRDKRGKKFITPGVVSHSVGV